MNSKLGFSVGIGCLVSILGTAASSLMFTSPASAQLCKILPPCRPTPQPMSELAIKNNSWIVQKRVVDPIYYADQYADLRRAFGYDDFALKKHWLENGIKEGRRSSPVFDVRYYLNSYPDLQRAFGRENFYEAVNHWYNGGIPEGRQGHPDFSAKCYLNRYPDLQRAFGASNYAAAMDHYMRSGRNENRNGKCG